MRSTGLKLAAVILMIALIAPILGSAESFTANTQAQQAQKVYPETLLLQLINQGKLQATNQAVGLLEEAVQARKSNSTLADILVAQAFMLLSNETVHPCRGLYRIAIGLNYTIVKLTKMVHRLNETTRGIYNDQLTQALYYLDEAKGNTSKAIEILRNSNGTCTNGTASTASHLLINARNDLLKARNIIDSLTACHFKQVILKTLEIRLIHTNMKIQALAMKKTELEQKGLNGAAKGLTNVEEKLSAENKVLLNTIREMNNTVNCTKLWATVAAFKMLHNYEVIQGTVISHFQNRAGMLIKGEMHLTMIAFRLERASEIISNIEENAMLPSNVKANLRDISANLDNITKLYHEALTEAWNGSPELNQTEAKLLSLITGTQNLIENTTNILPKGFKQTKVLLDSVSKTLLLVESMVKEDFKGVNHAGNQIRLAKEIVYKMEVKTLIRDTRLALIITEKSCNSINNTVIEDLKSALNYVTNASQARNVTNALSELNTASELVNNAEQATGNLCPEIKPVLVILEMEYNTTLTILT